MSRFKLFFCIGVILISTVMATQLYAETTQQHGSSKISGTVVYYFNANFGDKPDTGSKIFLIKDTPKFSLKKVDFLLDVFNELHVNNSSSGEFPLIASTLVDGSGHYEIDVKPGKYILLIQSAHTRNIDETYNVTGNIFLTHIIIRKGENRDVSKNFGITYF